MSTFSSITAKFAKLVTHVVRDRFMFMDVDVLLPFFRQKPFSVSHSIFRVCTGSGVEQVTELIQNNIFLRMI